MTPQEINIAIAEACNALDRYVIIKHDLYYRPDAHGYTNSLSDAWVVDLETAKKHEYKHGYSDDVTIRQLPPKDYYNDLNACAEFRQHLSRVEYITYYVELNGIVARSNSEPGAESINACDATAPQRCEAFLRVKGIWKGGE